MMSSGSVRSETESPKPSVWAATGLILAYMAVVFTLQATTGVDYEEWFDTADNALRTGVIPLAVGSVMILIVGVLVGFAEETMFRGVLLRYAA